MRTEIKERIIRIITKVTNTNEESLLQMSSTKFDELGINSIEIIKLLVYVENEFDIEFSDDFLGTTNFQTIDELVDIVVELAEEQ